MFSLFTEIKKRITSYKRNKNKKIFDNAIKNFDLPVFSAEAPTFTKQKQSDTPPLTEKFMDSFLSNMHCASEQPFMQSSWEQFDRHTRFMKECFEGAYAQQHYESITNYLESPYRTETEKLAARYFLLNLPQPQKEHLEHFCCKWSEYMCVNSIPKKQKVILQTFLQREGQKYSTPQTPREKALHAAINASLKISRYSFPLIPKASKAPLANKNNSFRL